MCERVDKRIECTECGYPASEALYFLTDDGQAIEPITKAAIPDPGHTNGEL